MIDGARIKIAGVAPLGAPARQRSGGFRVAQDPAAAVPPEMALEPAGLEGLLAMQEAWCEPEGDQPARAHGQAALEDLARVQLSLLTQGAVPSATLHRLAALARRIPYCADPRLRDALGAIALRARVELAKRR